MKRFLILSLLVMLPACTSVNDRGSLSEDEIAAQEAEQLRQEEAARIEQERSRRRAAMTDEQRERYDAMTDEQRERYDAMTDEQRERYDAMTDEQRERYDAMTDEVRERYDAMTEDERAHYDAMTEDERARYDAMTDSERAQYTEERKREEARIEEERRQEEARIEEERRQEEIRIQSELAQIEELRQRRLEDNDDPSLIGMVTEEQLREANPLLLEQSIYYDYNQYSVKTEYAPIISAHARFLVSHPTVKIFIEGNCDDRGSPEYNIALGQRRSDSIERALLTLGVPARQIESVSFGAERPVAYGQNDDAWSRNRRADIAYPMLRY